MPLHSSYEFENNIRSESSADRANFSARPMSPSISVAFACHIIWKAELIAQNLFSARMSSEKLEYVARNVSKIRSLGWYCSVWKSCWSGIEKVACGWYANVRAELVSGSHIQIQIVDERVSLKRIACIRDLSMRGAHKSVITHDIPSVLERFVNEIAYKSINLCLLLQTCRHFCIFPTEALLISVLISLQFFMQFIHMHGQLMNST